jgi:hypothetical protein
MHANIISVSHLTHADAAVARRDHATQVLKAGQDSAKKLASTYLKIDFLRPYFDVEPVQIRTRCVFMCECMWWNNDQFVSESRDVCVICMRLLSDRLAAIW